MSFNDMLDDDDEVIALTPEQEAELGLALAQAARGEGVPAEQLLAEMRARTE